MPAGSYSFRSTRHTIVLMIRLCNLLRLGMHNVLVVAHMTLRLNGQNLADEQYVDRVGGGHYNPRPAASGDTQRRSRILPTVLLKIPGVPSSEQVAHAHQIPRLRGLVQRDAVRGAAGWRWRAAAGWRRSVGRLGKIEE